MAVAVPVRDMKNTAEFTALVSREGVVNVTRNGYDAFTCVAADQRRAELEQLAKASLLSRILLAEGEYETGDYRDYDDFSQELRERHGL